MTAVRNIVGVRGPATLIPKPRKLSERELEVMTRLVDHKGSVPALAQQMQLNTRTVYRYAERAMFKMRTSTIRETAEALGLDTSGWPLHANKTGNWSALVGRLEAAFEGCKALTPEQAEAIYALSKQARS